MIDFVPIYEAARRKAVEEQKKKMKNEEEIEAVMKRCQRGTRGYNEANDLHADCYGTIGALRARVMKLEGRLNAKTTDNFKAASEQMEPVPVPYCPRCQEARKAGLGE